jgi:hypothetical protein
VQVFSGEGGALYRVGDPYRFSAVLEDCGDGFDWRPADPALRFWLDEPLRFAVFRGVWEPLEPLAVYRRSGRVAFGRCLAGSPVRARGVCRPLSVAAACAAWRLEALFEVSARSTLVDESARSAMVPLEQRASLEGVEPLVSGRMLAVLPFGAGAFVGMGDSTANGPGTVLAFDEKGVKYVLC